jgi:hypothetical protein
MNIDFGKGISMHLTSWPATVDRYIREGRTVSGGCGASSQQKQIEQGQQTLFNTASQQAKDVFGDSSTTFNDLMDTFAPTVAAGPNQAGFSATEDAALKSGAITNTGQAYRNASTAVKEANAAVGGGNEYLPGGAEIGKNIEVANEGAARTASALNQIDEANYATGRQNYDTAVAGMEQAPSVFNTASTSTNAATGSGEAAANTANQIAQQNNSWVSAVTGAVGGLAGDVVTGGMSNLGKGAGFFGQSA